MPPLQSGREGEDSSHITVLRADTAAAEAQQQRAGLLGLVYASVMWAITFGTGADESAGEEEEEEEEEDNVRKRTSTTGAQLVVGRLEVEETEATTEDAAK
jgi:hypothetical protein